jgi:hypothetical protein
MAIFPNIETDTLVQVNDRFRILAEKSFITQDETPITAVNITPELGGPTIDVFDNSQKNWFLDWEYATDGTKLITLELVNGGGSQFKTFSVEAITEADDRLFSTDQDLAEEESDILRFVPKGRNTFKYAHRNAQKQILDYLYRIAVTDIDRNKITKEAIVDLEEVREWSKFLTLKLIFADLVSTPNDHFSLERDRYMIAASESANKAIFKLDLDGDGTVESSETVNLTNRPIILR